MTAIIVHIDDPAALDVERFGPKGASQAALDAAGLPTPGGALLSASAYRRQIEHLGIPGLLEEAAEMGLQGARRHMARIRIAIHGGPILEDIEAQLLAAWQRLKVPGKTIAVRSSSLIEDQKGSSFAGQFESFLGLTSEDEFLTAVKACWAALWSPRAMRHMDEQAQSPGATAMALIIQPTIDADFSGGGMSLTAVGGMTITATRGPGSQIAQGEVVPDSYVLDAEGKLLESSSGRAPHMAGCAHHAGNRRGPDPGEPGLCLSEAEIAELAGYLARSEAVVGGPAEIEWVKDGDGFKLVQARPLVMEAPVVPDEIWRRHPGVRGQPSGIGWASGRACVITCECELGRVAPGDVLVTKVAGPALSHILPRVSAVVAELGGSTSHLASLARERGIPMVLGVDQATTKIPDGAQVGVDGVAGIVRWID